MVRSCREGRSPTVSVCILPLRLLKSLLFIQHKDLATNFPFCELCAPPRYLSFLFVFASVTQQSKEVISARLIKMCHFFVTVVCR